MPTAKENIERYEREIDWQKWVDMAMADPPNPWQLAAWVGHYGKDFDVAYGHWPTIENYPAPVQRFFETLAKVTPKGAPCRDERHLVKVRKAWKHAVFRDGYEMNLDALNVAKAQGIPYNGQRWIKGGETPSESIISDIADAIGVSFGAADKLINPRKK